MFLGPNIIISKSKYLLKKANTMKKKTAIDDLTKCQRRTSKCSKKDMSLFFSAIINLFLLVICHEYELCHNIDLIL